MIYLCLRLRVCKDQNKESLILEFIRALNVYSFAAENSPQPMHNFLLFE